MTSTELTCLPPAALGEVCQGAGSIDGLALRSCGEGLSCEDGACVPNEAIGDECVALPGAGEDCLAGDACAGDAYCAEGQCVAKGGAGATSASAGQCLSNICLNETQCAVETASCTSSPAFFELFVLFSLLWPLRWAKRRRRQP